MKGLIIKSPWIEKILSGKKTWEIRGSNTKIRGKIGLIRSGSGKIIGTCELVGVKGPLSLSEFEKSTSKHRIEKKYTNKLPYTKTYAWIIKNAQPLKRPRAYKHSMGAVIWVNLS